MSTLSVFSRQLAKLIPAVGSADFPDLLIQSLRELVEFNDGTILVYPGTDLPIIEYFEVSEKTGTSALDIFIRGAFVLDPFYLAANRDRKFGVFRLRDLAPPDFKNSEYYKSWYRNCGYTDECGFLVPIGEEGFVNIALAKIGPRATFSKRQVGILESIQPAIEAVCQQHWTAPAAEPAAVNLRAQLHAALHSFGSTLLTEREAQVINMVLHGHSTRTLAEKLSISMETVKLHRKHAYAKLEVRSQAELFYLFLDSLMSASDYAGGDTLVSYMQAPTP